MMEKNEQIERITAFESVLDRGAALTAELSEALDRLKTLLPELRELEAYYTGDLWKQDHADDEAGLLPQSLRRGVLSEDAVNDLLDVLCCLKAQMADILSDEKQEKRL